MTRGRYDVVIVGGGIVGSCIAYFLAADESYSGKVAVVEADPSYARSATCLSAASIRQQFSTGINVRISQFGMEYLRAAPRLLAVDGYALDIALTERTYLYLATVDAVESLRRNAAMQRSLGVEVELLDVGALTTRFPFISASGLAAAASTRSGEGWFDAHGLLLAVRRKARSLGVHYVTAMVESFVQGRGDSLNGVRLADSSIIEAGVLVCAAGTRSPQLLAPLEIPMPVAPRKRTVFVFDAAARTPDCPLIVDPSGFWLRPEGSSYLCGMSPYPDPAVDADDFEPDATSFEEAIWPALAQRIPDFEALRVSRFWVGHYDYNVFDQNAFIGHVPQFRNLLIACGFSGHGLQQAPAVGRALAELVVHGRYRSLDLADLSYDRYVRNEPLMEANVI